MATCLKNFRQINGIKTKMLTLVDVMCPVCHEIIIEPVVMPCSHGMCLECFESTVEKSNLSCPMCRKRLGSWLRTATKGKQLVNVKFWEQIKKAFPDHVQAKLNGLESTEDVLFNTKRKSRVISSPGEIRKEYEKGLVELRREEEAAQRKREEEERASVEFIKKIQKEEVEQRQYEEEERASEAYIKQLEEEEKLRREEELKQAIVDEQLAKELQGMGATEVTPPATSSNKEIKTAERKKGPMDHFLMANRSLSNLSDCSHDSIVQETHHFFRPVKVYPKTPPKKLPGGLIQEVQLVRATPRNLNKAMATVEESGGDMSGLFRTSSSLNVVLEQLRGGNVHSSAFSGCRSTDGPQESGEEYETPKKRYRAAPHTDTSPPTETPPDPVASCSGVPAPATLEMQRRAELLIQQEREDFRLAWQLQKEFDSTTRLVDRRKGSSRAYELRKNGDKRQTTLEEAFRSRRARNT